MSKVIKEIAVSHTVNKVVGFDVSLTVEEAVTLSIILSMVGGNPAHTLRGYAEQVKRKLSSDGLSAFNHFTLGDFAKMGSGSITFFENTKDYDKFKTVVEQIANEV